MSAASDRIEILSVSLLDTQWKLVEEMRRISEELNINLGWHYLLDLSWAAREISPAPGIKVIDAGAGVGLMQWWLADHGVNVISVDRGSRAQLDSRFRAWCPVQGMRQYDLRPVSSLGLRDFLPPTRLRDWHLWPQNLVNALSRVVTKESTPSNDRGTVIIYNQDLANLSDIAHDSVDAVVSISALEHNDPKYLRLVVAELMRVLKPGRQLIATLGASKDRDWLHEPSKGWCYTEDTLRDIFDLPTDCPSNYDCYDELFEALKDCAELRDGLASCYYLSGDNGMPWGIWKPEYQPVGVCKVKT